MRKMISSILKIVVAASFVCMAAILVMTANVDSIIRQYEEELKVYVQNRQDIHLLGQEFYHLESLLWTQILVDGDESVYAENEKDIAEAQANIEEMLARLDTRLMDSTEKEQLHQVSKSYGSFANHISVVISLSHDQAISAAEYYVNTNMIPYLRTARKNLTDISDSITDKCAEVENKMDKSISLVNLTKAICIVVVLGILLSCISLVIVNSRRIIVQQEREKRSHQQRIMDLQYQTIVSMANLIENRDGETGEHVKRTAAFVQMITEALEENSKYSHVINRRFKENMWKAAPLHDIGKIKIPDAILNKPGRLTDDEFAIMKTHAPEGGDIIEGTISGIEEEDYLEVAHDVARFHHERWDGAGYPDNLKGEEIPLCARIMAVADVFDAFVSERCYKKPMSIDKAYEIILEESGTHFDPEVVKVFVKIRPKVESVINRQS